MEESIFFFSDCRALQCQDNAVCERLFDDFFERLAANETLDLLQEKLSRIQDSVRKVYWLATYASVIVIRRLDSRYSSITLIGLDGWESAVHSSINGRESIALPNLSKPAHYPLGRLLTASVETVLWHFRERWMNQRKTTQVTREDSRQVTKATKRPPRLPERSCTKLW